VPSRCRRIGTTLGPEPAARNTFGETEKRVMTSSPWTDTGPDLVPVHPAAALTVSDTV
jgi:hypothetical protein